MAAVGAGSGLAAMGSCYWAGIFTFIPMVRV